LTPRLALRDASRNRSRSAPAVAAILAGVTGATALSVYIAAMDDSDRRRYTPTLPAGTATVQLSMWDPQGMTSSTADPATIHVSSRRAAGRRVAVLRSLDQSCLSRASGVPRGCGSRSARPLRPSDEPAGTQLRSGRPTDCAHPVHRGRLATVERRNLTWSVT
jgi:hypothetical protein